MPVPSCQVRQLSQRKLAVMVVLVLSEEEDELLVRAAVVELMVEMPVPGSMVIWVLLVYWGSKWPRPERGERVILVDDEVYRRNMLAPVIWAPWPRPTHWMEVGAVIWM